MIEKKLLKFTGWFRMFYFVSSLVSLLAIWFTDIFVGSEIQANILIPVELITCRRWRYRIGL